MKPTQSWRFSAPLFQVDLSRILRESRVHAGAVVRFAIDGQEFTGWSNRHFDPADLSEQQYAGPGDYSVVAGDRVGQLLGRVVTTVEVFGPYPELA